MLTLKISNFLDVQSEYGQKSNQKQFTELGGMVGRHPQCEWVLHDSSRRVSSKHLLVEHQYGDYYITDMSTNGTKINGYRIEKNSPTKLKAGDIIELGLYKITVASVSKQAIDQDLQHIMSDANHSKNSINEPLGFLNESDISSQHKHLPFESNQNVDIHHHRDPFAQLQNDVDFTPEMLAQQKPASPVQSKKPREDEFIEINDDFGDFAHIVNIDDESIDDMDIPQPEPVRTQPRRTSEQVHHRAPPTMQQPQRATQPSMPQHTAPQQTSHDELFLKTLCQRTGMDFRVMSQLDKEKIFTDIVDILTYSLDGVIRLMMERNSAKNKLDSDLTMFTSQVKNPLKMSMSSKQALETILFDTSNTVMPARQAVGESLNEIVEHFKLVESSVRGVLDMFIDKFNPEAIEKEVSQSIPLVNHFTELEYGNYR